jgi:hypothetical protein
MAPLVRAKTYLDIRVLRLQESSNVVLRVDINDRFNVRYGQTCLVRFVLPACHETKHGGIVEDPISTANGVNDGVSQQVENVAVIISNATFSPTGPYAMTVMFIGAIRDMHVSQRLLSFSHPHKRSGGLTRPTLRDDGRLLAVK